MTKTGGHCHRFKSALWCCSLSSEITAHLSQQTWCWHCENPLANVSPAGLLIRSNHAVAHTLVSLYLHLNLLISPPSISPHNWMKRRNISVTLECLHDLYFLLNICVQSAAGRRKHQHLCWLSWDWIHTQNKEEKERLVEWDQTKVCEWNMLYVCLNVVVELVYAHAFI